MCYCRIFNVHVQLVLMFQNLGTYWPPSGTTEYHSSRFVGGRRSIFGKHSCWACWRPSFTCSKFISCNVLATIFLNFISVALDYGSVLDFNPYCPWQSDHCRSRCYLGWVSGGIICVLLTYYMCIHYLCILYVYLFYVYLLFMYLL